MQITNFNATGIAPQQLGGAHPAMNSVPFVITNTYGQETKNKDGGMLCVQFTSQHGNIVNRYNLFNKSEAAVDIARKQLSALSHATGVFELSFLDSAGNVLPMDQWARELRNARGVMDVGFQDGSDKYTELKKVYDAAGNEPGKGPAAAPQPQQAGGWGQTAPAAQPAAQPQQSGNWAPAAAASPAQNSAPPANSGGWQPGPAGAGGANPPWAGPK